mmetsp:Transcript_11729/g.16274  ORF Transcript_11729/g.16274 Transcript_11729/m.16274 type:complete len:347 (+) Transcript_11729:115-1155(+)
MGKDANAEGAPFVVKTYQLVSDDSTNDYVTWSETEDSFVVLKPVEFASDILPRYFKHNNFCSFIRQLNTYGFHKVETKQWEFKHEFFIRGQPELLKQIVRRKSKKRDSSPTPEERHAPSNNTQTPPPYQPKEPLAAVTPPSSIPTPTMTPTHQSNSPTTLFQSPNLQIPAPETYQEVDEVEHLRDMNNKLIAEITRLNEQQETTQMTIKQILNELIESRKAQQTLEQKVHLLARELQLKTLLDTTTEPVKQDKVRQVKQQPFGFAPVQHNLPQIPQTPSSYVEQAPAIDFNPTPNELEYLQTLIEGPDMESALNSILTQNGYPTELERVANGHTTKLATYGVSQPY